MSSILEILSWDDSNRGECSCVERQVSINDVVDGSIRKFKLWARSEKEAVHKFRVIIERLKEESISGKQAVIRSGDVSVVEYGKEKYIPLEEESFWRDLSHYFKEVTDA